MRKVAAEHELSVGVPVPGGGEIPGLGSRTIRQNVVPAEHSAEAEPGADMSLLRGLAEKRERAPMVARATATAEQKHGEGDFRIEHSACGGAGDPSTAFLRRWRDAAALEKHAAIPVLCVHDAIGDAAAETRSQQTASLRSCGTSAPLR